MGFRRVAEETRKNEENAGKDAEAGPRKLAQLHDPVPDVHQRISARAWEAGRDEGGLGLLRGAKGMEATR